jgi:hypothetical protein
MTYRMYGALIASVGAVALLLAGSETFAASAVAARGGVNSAHAMSHPAVARSFRHHRRNDGEVLWPAIGGYDYTPPNGDPLVNTPQPAQGDLHTTYTYDVPWDWAHRYPPAVTPSDRPYVSSCPAEDVMVPGRGGQQHTVTVTRCY